MNRNLILFLVLAAAAAIAYFILTSPVEQQAAPNGGSIAGGGPNGTGSDLATALGASVGTNPLEGILTALTTTPNPGLVSIMTMLFKTELPNIGTVEAYGYPATGDKSAVVSYFMLNGRKIKAMTDEYGKIMQAITNLQKSRA